MARKITIFLIFILAGLATFLAGYLFSRQPVAVDLDQQALINNSLITRFEKTPEKYGPPTGVFSLSREEADFITLSASGKELIYYVPKSGEVRSAEIQNPLAGSTLLAKIPAGVQKISGSLNKTLVAIYPSGGVYYDLNSGFSKKLDPKVKNPVLSKSGSQLAYDYFDEEQATGEIRVSDPKMEAFKKIMSTVFENWQIDWLTNAKLSLVKPPSPENSTYWLFTLDTADGRFERILDTKTDLEILWSPNGQKLIYSGSDPSTQVKSLNLLDPTIGQEIGLNIKTTASRCVWSIDNKNIYCATPDSFVALDTSNASNIPKDIFDSSQSNISEAAANAVNLILSSSEDYLIFKNSQDGKLYGLSLSQ